MDRAERPGRLEAALVPAGAAAFAGLIFLALDDAPLIDWDAIERVQFIERYRLDYEPDGHVLYNGLLRGLVALGVAPLAGTFALTAVGYGLLVVTGWWVARARGLRGRALAVAVASLALASPGLAALCVTAEDNVLYLAPLLAAFHVATTPARAPAAESRRGALAGALLAVATLINVTVVLYVAVLPIALVLALAGRRAEATRLASAGVAMIGVYYLAHLLLFRGAPIAAHTFLPQALALQDYEASRTPLGSWARLEQYAGGARATALIPSLHAMAPPDAIAILARRWAPAALLGVYAVVAARAARRAWVAGGDRSRWLLAALPGIAFAFPYFYEPVLIERWDMAWLWLFLGFVAVLRSRPRAGVEVLVAGAIALQAAGTTLVLAHHFGRAYEREDETELRELVAELGARSPGPVVLPLTFDRYHLAYVSHHHPERRILLIGREGAEPVCHHIIRPLVEFPLACADAASAIDGAPAPYVHWQVSPDDLEAARSALDAE